jgi:hypothetical protein
MAAQEYGTIERCKQAALTFAIVLRGKYPCMGKAVGVLNAKIEFSGHLPRGEKPLGT